MAKDLLYRPDLSYDKNYYTEGDIYDFNEEFDTVLIVRPKYDCENYLNNKKSLERLKKKVKMI